MWALFGDGWSLVWLWFDSGWSLRCGCGWIVCRVSGVGTIGLWVESEMWVWLDGVQSQWCGHDWIVGGVYDVGVVGWCAESVVWGRLDCGRSLWCGFGVRVGLVVSGVCDMGVVWFMGGVCDVGVDWVVLCAENIHDLFFMAIFHLSDMGRVWWWAGSGVTMILVVGGVCDVGVILWWVESIVWAVFGGGWSLRCGCGLGGGGGGGLWCGCGLGVFCAKNIHNLFCHDHFPPCTVYDPVLNQNWCWCYLMHHFNV